MQKTHRKKVSKLDKSENELYKSRDWLYQRVINEKKSYEEIADITNTEVSIVKEWSKKLGISSVRTVLPPLSQTHPHLVEEWDFEKNDDSELTPNSVTKGSNYYVWWKCSKGHEWNMQINPRARRSHGCPYCSGRYASPEYNFTNDYPELLKLWNWSKNTRNPTEYTQGSSEQVWWQCNEGHEYESTVANKIRHVNCPYCTGKRVSKETSLGFLYENVASEWHSTLNENLTPFDVLPFSMEKVWWKCIKGDDHEWKATVNSRHKNGCPYCSGRHSSKDYNLEAVFPEVAKEWDYSKNSCKPKDVTPKTNSVYWWKCEFGHEWEASPASRNRVGRSSECPYCSNSRVWEEYNLEYNYPEIALEWDYEKNDTKPSEHMPRTDAKIWWKCKEGHSWRVGISNRTSSGNDCPYCSGTFLTEEKSLAYLNPEIAKEWHPTKNKKTPSDYHAVSGFKAWWMCENGHEYQCLISDKTNGIGCSYCSKKRASEEYNLESENPGLLSEWDFKKNSKHPSQFTPKSNQKVWWICKFGHSFEMAIKNKANGSGCSDCISARFTSYPEQFFYFYLSQLFTCLSREKIDDWEADILLEDFDVVIEYDGWYWHKDKIETDILKNKVFHEDGYRIIRIRELGLPIIEGSVNITSPKTYEDLYPTLKTLLKELIDIGITDLDYINENLSVDKEKDSALISLNLLSVDEENSIKRNSEKLSLFWDNKKNKDVTPEMVSIKSNLNYFWRCTDDQSHTWIETPANMLKRKNKTCTMCEEEND